MTDSSFMPSDQPPADQPSAVTSVVDRELAARLREELDGIENALARLDAGTYGICEFCQTPLDDEILARTPQASRCGAHLL